MLHHDLTMTTLVTGGAGYIGSHMVRHLLQRGYGVVVVDDLSSGRRETIPDTASFVLADVADGLSMSRTIREYEVDSVFHFASRIQVGESVRDPRLYYDDNLAATIALLDAVLDGGVRRFVLSSSAAVYGTPETVPVAEDAPTRPTNPYGETKLAIEKMLASYASAYGLAYAALRYFNAAGADADAGLGECHEPETHLIPLVLEAAAGQRERLTVFGTDYATPDGTCVRDYVHVLDLADAHLEAMAHLERGGPSGAFNLGSGTGYSVAEVIATCRSVTGRDIAVTYGPRRSGDPAALVACPKRAEATLGWRARRSSLERIIQDAWAWHSSAHIRRKTAAEAVNEEEMAHAR